MKEKLDETIKDLKQAKTKLIDVQKEYPEIDDNNNELLEAIPRLQELIEDLELVYKIITYDA